jgi:nickel-type superoxide dismutase maturation protease
VVFPFSRYKVVGHSMEPLYPEGKVVWVFRWYFIFNLLREGQVIIFHFQNKNYLKRIKKVERNLIWVEGDNQEDSFDSRKFGPIKRHNVLGKVL